MATAAVGRKVFGPQDSGADDALSELFAQWTNNQEVASEGTKVLSGGLITPDSVAGKLAIAAGMDEIEGGVIRVPAATGINALSVTNVVPSTGRAWSVLEVAGPTVTVTPGSSAEAPDSPHIPAQVTDGVIHGYLLVPAGAGAIDTDLTNNNGNAKLIDGRIINPVSNSGWKAETAPASYVSATSIKLTGKNRTARYTAGRKLFWLGAAGGYRYGIVVSSSYGAGDTTITLAENLDYAVDSAGIADSSLLYSDGSPADFPGRFGWLPIATGFSTPPNYQANGGLSGCWFSVNGKICTIGVNSTNGTSNANTFYITNLPIPMGGVYPQICYGIHLGQAAAAAVRGQIILSSGTSQLDIRKDEIGGVWATTGNKNAQFVFSYPIG